MELRSLAVCVRVDGKPINSDADDLDVTAGWGHAGQGGVTMPGRGRIEETLNAQRSTLNAQNLNVERSLDIFLNDAVCWRNVPKPVWDYTLGGYQVVKKWLSYGRRQDGSSS